jgi:DAK2 domain fusion protein YloV
VLQFIIETAEETLAKTPEMLPVLKQAGVVDAGGKGFVVILKGMQSVLKDGIFIESAAAEGKPSAEKSEITKVFDGFTDEDIKFAYCTEFIINKNKNATVMDVSAFRAYIESFGDSAVVVDDDTIVKVHVHSNNPGKVIEKAITIGYLTNIKIDNMRQQHTHLLNTEPSDEAQETEKTIEIAPNERKYGFVAVAAGEGLESVFKDLGIDRMVEGGQTMNPSTEDILNAINQTPSEIVFVLPNNKNIIMAAEMAVPLTSKKAIVIPTKTIPQGISAMLAFDESADDEQNTKAMTDAIATVKTAQITFAVRNSVFDGKEIKEGQILGLLENKVSVVDDSIESVALELLEMIKDGASYMNIYYGSDVSDEDAQKLYGEI